MINKLLTISLLILFTITFSACEDKKSNSQVNKEKKEVKFTPKLKIPEWDEDGGKKIWNTYKNWHDAKHDPIPAMKIGYAYSEELHDYKKAFEWFKYANSMIPLGENSYFACYALQQLKRYDEAISWCNNAIELKWDKALYQLATVYYKKKDFNNALIWFTKAYEKGEKTAITSLGLANEKIGNYKEAENWYKIGIKESNINSYHNIGRFYFYIMKDNLRASAYAIALIDKEYTKSSVLKVLQKEWKIPNETIKKGYELQLNSPEFPIHYDGKLDLK
ncbi:hypothetical protein CRV08_09605 [Halarcobacter ebronensis]|uniref:Uncharacterized protein n=1 Tax=Halarcobacter ebronensis TaxID=1462615 RepID=A0A4Q0YCB3_9BACT|nr:sel1 repeat family protein [Halarcobacter ebronensis]RXJ67615.1 hypothetical protein CRV08_09605 [Halarcobacter ebronensis]